ncbi:MAG: DUF4173 domain-containing protein, partial [Bacilli bacterium]|nr:DUF4173 domain-containing protein [Bacilli bacterium]
ISNMILNFFILPILIVIMFVTLTNKNYKLSRTFINWLVRIFPGKIFSNFKELKNNINIKKTNKRKLRSILLGILIGIPFVVIIMLLLTSADMYFSTFLSKILNYLNIDTIWNNFWIFVIYFIILFTVIVNIIRHRNTVDKEKPLIKVDHSLVSTILIMINLVFTLFIISELSKLLGNFLQLPVEYTYAEYAREGFFQLLIVTIINFSIILFFLYKTNIIKENTTIKRLTLLLITFTIILIFNSYYRMYLYMHEFGFTILRSQVVLFLTMELILSLIIVKKIVSGIKHKDAPIFASIMITTYVLNIFICNQNCIDYINKLLNITIK